MRKSLIAFVALGLLSGLSLAAESEGVASEAEATEAPAPKIYRTTDEKGNVVFTDKPGESRGSEEVKLKTINTVPIKKVDMPEVIAKPEDAGGSQAQEYTSLTITAPENGSTVRNPTDAVYVSVNLQPGLQPGDSLVLFDNGVELPAMQLDAPERGVHNLIAKVISADGETRIISEPVEVYIHRSTVSDFRNAPGGGSNGGAAQVGGAAERGGTANVGGSASTGGAATVGDGAERGNVAQPAKPNRSIRNN